MAGIKIPDHDSIEVVVETRPRRLRLRLEFRREGFDLTESVGLDLDIVRAMKLRDAVNMAVQEIQRRIILEAPESR